VALGVLDVHDINRFDPTFVTVTPVADGVYTLVTDPGALGGEERPL
jgi:hypothetical protein